MGKNDYNFWNDGNRRWRVKVGIKKYICRCKEMDGRMDGGERRNRNDKEED